MKNQRFIRVIVSYNAIGLTECNREQAAVVERVDVPTNFSHIDMLTASVDAVMATKSPDFIMSDPRLIHVVGIVEGLDDAA